MPLVGAGLSIPEADGIDKDAAHYNSMNQYGRINICWIGTG